MSGGFTRGARCTAAMRKGLIVGAVAGTTLLASIASSALAVVVTVNPADSYVGFMNVSELPANGGAAVFNSSWGTPDLVANFTGPNLKLEANHIGDTDPFWYVGGGAPGHPGNKNMDANMYVEPVAGTYAGQTVTFTGNVLSNTFVSPYTTVAFIKDFAPDYSSNVTVTVPLTPGVFSISLPAINDPGRHVQYGFETIGPDSWVTDYQSKGSAIITAVPEPVSLSAAAMGMVLAGARRRRRA